MKDELEIMKSKMVDSLKDNPFCQYLGLEFIELDNKFCKARIPFKKEILNPYGTTHGGALYSIADIVAGTVACLNGKYCTTVDGHMNYLEPATSKDFIYCEAKKVRGGKHLIVVKVKIKNDAGKLLDDGSFTFFRTEIDVVK